MESNEDDDMELRYLASKEELVELMEEALRAGKAAATAGQSHPDDEIDVVGGQEDGEPKSLDAIGMRERRFDAKTLGKDRRSKMKSDPVVCQTEFRCPQPDCRCVFKHRRDLIRHIYNTRSAPEVGQFQVSSEDGSAGSSSQLQDNPGITYTDSDRQSANDDDEVFEIIVLSGDKANWQKEIAKWDREISELNKQIAIETGEAGESSEAGGGDGIDGDGRRFRWQHPGNGRLLKSKDGLRQHRSLHTTWFQCRVCRKRFISMKDLKRHQSVHQPDYRPFVCGWPGCGDTFKKEVQLEEHRKVMHSTLMQMLMQKKSVTE